MMMAKCGEAVMTAVGAAVGVAVGAAVGVAVGAGVISLPYAFPPLLPVHSPLQWRSLPWRVVSGNRESCVIVSIGPWRTRVLFFGQ